MTDLDESLKDGVDVDELADIMRMNRLQCADRCSGLRKPGAARARLLRKVEGYRIGS